MQPIKVPWLTKKSIAAAAAGVITDYEAKIKRRVLPPISVEKIIERGLSLKLGFIDLRKKLELDDVLGATFVKEGLIYVDRSLTENQNEGRLCFTVAHETGHWVLHRELVDQACRTGGGGGFIRLRRNKLEPADLNDFESDLGQNSKADCCGAISPSTFQQSEGGFIFCRIRDAKEPIEWQADFFAACLLMPEDKVREAFRLVWNAGSLVITNRRSALGGTALCVDPCVENWPLVADMVCEAGNFRNVSKQAMIIRLQELGLVANLAGEEIGWKNRSAG